MFILNVSVAIILATNGCPVGHSVIFYLSDIVYLIETIVESFQLRTYLCISTLLENPQKSTHLSLL